MERIIAVSAGKLILIPREKELVIAIVAEGMEEISGRAEGVRARRSIEIAGGCRQMRHENAHLRLVDAVLRLDREHVVALPRAASPIRHSLPGTGMLLHVGQHAVECGQAGLICDDAAIAEKQ